MLRRMLLLSLVLGLLLFDYSPGQNPAATPESLEFPVVLQQTVTAGKTPVGTKIQAKLAMATLFQGKVIPRNATFSGEVIESLAKTSKQPSRIGIRLETVNWKNGTADLTVYVTPLYYPTLLEPGQNLQYGPPQPASRTWNGAGAYPDPNSPAYKPFPKGDDDKDKTPPDTANPVTAKNRVPMKNVAVERGASNSVILVSKRSNIKLDRLTTYVVASGDLSQSK